MDNKKTITDEDIPELIKEAFRNEEKRSDFLLKKTVAVMIFIILSIIAICAVYFVFSKCAYQKIRFINYEFVFALMFMFMALFISILGLRRCGQTEMYNYWEIKSTPMPSDGLFQKKYPHGIPLGEMYDEMRESLKKSNNKLGLFANISLGIMICPITTMILVTATLINYV